MDNKITFYEKFYYGCVVAILLCCFLCSISVRGIVIEMLWFGSLTGFIVNAAYKLWEDYYLNF